MVDDGSPDHCPQMCDEYAKRDSRIKVIHKTNAGLGYARNSGLEIATGEYVAFVDSDDYVDTRMYESLYASAQQENADTVFCGFYIEVKNRKWVESNEVPENKVWKDDAVRNFMLDMIASAPYVKQERKYWMSVWHSIYKTSVIKDNNISFLSERDIVSEDIPFQVSFLKKSDKIVYLKKHFYYYCLNDSSLTKTFKVEKYQCTKKLRECLISMLVNETAIQRINRMFIGYCRSYVESLIKSKIDKKKRILRVIFEDDVWNEIIKTYKPQFLPLNSKIYYYLILRKKLQLLFAYGMIICWIKKFK